MNGTTITVTDVSTSLEITVGGNPLTTLEITNQSVSVLTAGQKGVSGIVNLGQLLDVTIGSPQNLQLLAYDSDSGEWYNLSIADHGEIYFEDIRTNHFVGTPVHIDNLQEWLDHIYSAGRVDGLALTENPDGTVDISSGVAIMRAVDDPHTNLFSVNIPEIVGLELTDNATNFIFAQYDDVTPSIGVTLNPGDINLTTTVPLQIVVKEGTHLTVYDVGEDSVDSNASLRKRFFYTDKFIRADGGSIISDAGTFHFSCTAGGFWFGLTSFTFEAFDTTGTDTFEYYRLINGVWVESDETIISATQYNDISVPGSEALVDLTNKHGVHWVYLIGSTSNPHFAVIYSQDSYSNLSKAEAATVPSNVPPSVEGLGILLGRFIVRGGIGEIIATETVFTETFSSSLATSHNSLADLQGGASGKYYHLLDYLKAGTGETAGFTQGAGDNVKEDSTFTGNIGSTAYNINDIVKALKQTGILAE